MQPPVQGEGCGRLGQDAPVRTPVGAALHPCREHPAAEADLSCAGTIVWLRVIAAPTTSLACGLSSDLRGLGGRARPGAGWLRMFVCLGDGMPGDDGDL